MSNNTFFADCMAMVGAHKNPSGVTVTNPDTSLFFRRYLLMKAMSVFKWKFPENWNAEYFLYTLYCRGSISIVETDKYGVIPQGGAPYGVNVMYQPTRYIITNPLLRGNLRPLIGIECCVFKMTPDWGGILDLVALYGDYMALAAQACGMNLINSHLAYVFLAENKTVAESFKKLYDNIACGNPATVADSKLAKGDGSLAVTMLQNNLSQNFITPQLMECWRNYENMFSTAIGIPNANTDKRERLIVDEVNANNAETMCTVDMWFASWKKTCKEVKQMFGVDVDVEWRVKPVEKSVETVENGGDADVDG